MDLLILEYLHELRYNFKMSLENGCHFFVEIIQSGANVHIYILFLLTARNFFQFYSKEFSFHCHQIINILLQSWVGSKVFRYFYCIRRVYSNT